MSGRFSTTRNVTHSDWYRITGHSAGAGTLAVILSLCLSALLGRAHAEGQSQGLVSKSTTAVGYRVEGGSTRVDLKGTELARRASGEAKVQAKKGITNIEVTVQGMTEPSKLGTEYLTYVLWAVSPEGSTNNIGELLTDKRGIGKLQATTQLQTFSLIVTAEPYFAVRQPSDFVVLENAVRKGTKGKIFPVEDYKLMKRGVYQKLGNPLSLSLDLKNVPLDLYQARNAVDIARYREAEKYAPEVFSKAEASLKMAETALERRASKKEILSTSRQAVQFSEDARALAVERQEQERIERERKVAAAEARAEAEAKAAAEAAEAKRRSDLEAKRQSELAAAREAQMKAEAEAAAARAKADADAAAARAKAEADILKAKEESAKAEAERARKAALELRAQLLNQFNRILETKDTPRGLVVTMGDVLFDTGKYDLRPAARERLARLSGIVLGHPGLRLEIEGHTDSTGTVEFNQRLSEQRARSTLNFLAEQGLPQGNLTAKGLGEDFPVADNDSSEGRQKNRRVEIIVSGEVIGTQIGR